MQSAWSYERHKAWARQGGGRCRLRARWCFLGCDAVCHVRVLESRHGDWFPQKEVWFHQCRLNRHLLKLSQAPKLFGLLLPR